MPRPTSTRPAAITTTMYPRDDEHRRQSTHILSAPSDISSASALPCLSPTDISPRPTGNNPTTAFTSTPTAVTLGTLINLTPDASQLIRVDNAGAKVTEIVELPMTTSQAATDTARCSSLIREGLPGCKVLMTHQEYITCRIIHCDMILFLQCRSIWVCT